MSDRRCFESFDRTLGDVLEQTSEVFGGKSVLLGGDFRQTLPVKIKASRIEVIDSTLPKSYLWQYFKVYKLNQNMRLASAEGISLKESILRFASWLLDVRDGKIGVPEANDPHNVRTINIPSDFLINPQQNAMGDLIRFIYDDTILSNPSVENLFNRAIVCPKNKTADEINDIVLRLTAGEGRTYLSDNSMIPHSQNRGDIDVLYPIEQLNLLNFNGIPPHKLNLKVKTPVMLIRNINQAKGLCNGTRLLVSQLLPRIIEAHIITGTSIGHRVYIPRINFVHNSKDLPFTFTRRQFPIKICYAMNINKSQGQSLKKIGVYLPHPIFTHGQLYVAFSRATSPDSLKVLIEPAEDDIAGTTKNIVFT